MADILKIAQSGLTAAQVGMATTSHNISNANTPGYSREIIQQGAVAGQNMGFGFVGKGTEVVAVKRVYNNFLAAQVQSTQASKSQLDTYSTQIQQIDNMLADSTTGLAPAMQSFFSGVQTATANPNDPASRQAMLSSAQALSSRFQSLGKQLNDIESGVNQQITTSVGTINSYAKQIAALNDSIEKLQASSDGSQPNDLLDQRDQLVANLSQEMKVSIVKQGNSYNVFVGNGQPLVVGNSTYTLVAQPSATDNTRMEVGVQNNGTNIPLAESSLMGGGNLAGLLEFRAQTLDPAKNALGRVAIGLADAFNQQHELGQDQKGALGGAFFNVGTPVVTSNSANAGNANLSATIVDAGSLTTSDYTVKYDATAAKYTVTRLQDGATTTFATFPQTIDGIKFDVPSGSMQDGDNFLVRPTVNGATSFSTLISDTTKIALAAPITTSTPIANTGSGTISAGVVNSTALMGGVTLNYDSTAGNLSGFPSGLDVTVTSGGVSTVYPAGTANVPYGSGDTVSFGGVDLSGIPTAADGSYTFGTPTATLTYSSSGGTFSGFPSNMDVVATVNGVSTTYPAGTAVPFVGPSDNTYSFGGVSVTVSGAPNNNDTFKVGPNTNGLGDSRNGALLGKLQTTNTLAGGTLTFSGAYTQFVSSIGNKANELQVTSQAVSNQYNLAVAAQQSESGVNLDEEATDLLRYQQAYQAAAKVIATASKLFETLLSLGT